MKGFCIFTASRVAGKVYDAVLHDVEDCVSKSEIPITVCVLCGALAGALIAGFSGVVVGGIIGVFLKMLSRKKKCK